MGNGPSQSPRRTDSILLKLLRRGSLRIHTTIGGLMSPTFGYDTRAPLRITR